MQGQVDRDRESWLGERQDEVWAEPDEEPVDARDDECHLRKGARSARGVRREESLTGIDTIKSPLHDTRPSTRNYVTLGSLETESNHPSGSGSSTAPASSELCKGD